MAAPQNQPATSPATSYFPPAASSSSSSSSSTTASPANTNATKPPAPMRGLSEFAVADTPGTAPPDVLGTDYMSARRVGPGGGSGDTGTSTTPSLSHTAGVTQLARGVPVGGGQGGVGQGGGVDGGGGGEGRGDSRGPHGRGRGEVSLDGDEAEVLRKKAQQGLLRKNILILDAQEKGRRQG
ncbi:hypothetical protein BT67DRAFT_436262 [Trichocladium antarcticum]|uniref:Uncharacterized protein n=1 Tax=Trichocladium antarcticum TaxID=1450529 RepID=A0AAN6UEP0_9PEZI|nr:hypothetical protein BT67DRAFT_436262 [Trichocladium antarcticum]